MARFAFLALALVAFAVPAAAQAPLTGTYELTKPNGDPVESGATWTSVIVPIPFGGYLEWLFRTAEGQTVLVPDECCIISAPDDNGEHQWQNNRGTQGKMWRDASGQLKSETTTGRNKGNVVHYKPN